jgi:signal transduction histidine kinase
VTDTGIGIREQDKEKLFKMFGSIKDEEKKLNLKGIGLGLVISKLIVEKFDGYIDFVSEF